jgi:hypothetical protein
VSKYARRVTRDRHTGACVFFLRCGDVHNLCDTSIYRVG